MLGQAVGAVVVAFVVVLALLALVSFYSIGPTEVGLVRKRFGRKLCQLQPTLVRRDDRREPT